MKKGLSLLLIVAVVFVTSFSMNYVQNGKVYADDFRVDDQKFFSEATLEDDFADDSVLVVLNYEASRSSKAYTTRDFVDIGCINVVDLSERTADTIRAQSEKSRTLEDESMRVDSGAFRKILKLELQTRSKEGVLSAIKQLEKRSDIVSADPNYFMTTFATPNDPYYGSGDQWAIDNIQLPQAWNLTTGSNTVVVGVLDTGIDVNHHDLTWRIAHSVSQDFTGTNPNALVDTDGHGTHVAGIIGAQGNNGLGITGVGWDIRLASLRTNNVGHIIEAISYATSKGITILNKSGGYFGSPNNALKTAIAVYPGLFVCAAGNVNGGFGYVSPNNDTSSTPAYPASFKLKNLISVGNSQKNDALFSGNVYGPGSCYGASTVDLFAPGYDVISTASSSTLTYFPNVGYEYRTGTSMASPHVAGVAALIKSAYPSLDAYAIKEAIMNGVDKISALSNLCVSGGRLNAFKALQIYNGGVGTVGNPYVLTTAQQVQNIKLQPDKHFVLGNDINLYQYGDWDPIPYLGIAGVLDGRGYSLHDLTIVSKTVGVNGENFGLFALNYGLIRNTNMTWVATYFAPDHGSTYSNFGAVCGVNAAEGTIDNVKVTGGWLQMLRCNSNLGGIAGTNFGVILDSQLVGFANGNRTFLQGNGNIGGIVGLNEVGGIVAYGYVNNIDIEHYLIYINRSVGGIVGYSHYASIVACNIYNSTISNIGQFAAHQFAPPMGMIVGGLNESILWYVGAANVQLISGSLIGSQLDNFGATPWWQWGGNYWGNCDIR
ncbi:MAG: S8 family serine peptidase [Firmicutes bacterium]|nr:S8 family serine peptidase [Bacillota bacterium]